jgi:hypothetical protein
LNTSDGIWLDPAHRPFDGISRFEVDNLYVYPENGSNGSFSIGCDVVQSGDPGGGVHMVGIVNAGIPDPG